MSDEQQVDYAAAARIGISREPQENVSDDPRLTLLEDCLLEVVRQLEDELGWMLQFKVEKSWGSSLIAIYHLSICQMRKRRWWSVQSWDTPLYKYLGTIVFRYTSNWEEGWTSPVGFPAFDNFKFEGRHELPRSLEKFFATPEVGQILRQLFGRVR